MAEVQSGSENFLKAIEKYAEEQRNKIRFESESFKKQELEKAESEGLREAYTLIQREMAAIRTEISSQLSRDEMASRKKIFEKRNKMTENVFEKVTQKLVEFTKTADYEKLMLESVKKIAQTLKADDVIFFVKESDLKLADKIKAAYTAERLKDKKLADKIKSAFSPSCEVKSSKEIKIGGITGRSAGLGLIADETLDTKLDGQREWFYQNSGLRVTE
ncbi:MAG: V-type ATP synthase subunit E [Candidatus Pseudoruminococcus sp.]|uniref:V-type ATP synthase subunit E n=1 Tax=Candidatus Pseudoruminococcus sp. TaxID=3101048 RepID=UPI002A7A9C35|nr:V-type ATP synthase subunit E [Ruminococcus sp.]MDY2781843.1 V-type ATP synthase subunit E [Candidatus Pseudoruminococcus sp.]